MTGSGAAGQTANTWTQVAAREAGFTGDMGALLDKAIADKRIWNLHGLLVAHKERIAFERYAPGDDWSWGGPLGRVDFTADTLHDLRSVTKSIVGLLYGIALAEGKVPPPDAPLMASFPEYVDLAADPARAQLTIRHVLTMTMGTDWDETTVPYTDPSNSEIAMEFAPDRYRFVLSRPVVTEPGRRWSYSGGATALLGRLIARGSGTSLHSFARTRLFDPLGIGPTEWIKGRDGIESAASGLRMTPRDLARIGRLVLGGGTLGGRRIVDADWVASCVTPALQIDEVRQFGYQWYIAHVGFDTPSRPPWDRHRLERYWGGFGNGGQRLFVLPGLDLVVVTTAGNYDTPDQWIPPFRALREVVLKALG
jgi:CubicO group peptidase (beta-lactamase class C family)